LYGGTYRLFKNVRERSAGLSTSFVDMADLARLKAAIRPETKMIWVETPSNPLLKLIDLAAVAKIARAHDLIAVADNTFATPWIQRPLELGFDIVVHSATKYLNGHSDMVGGVVVVSAEPRLQALSERLAYLQNAVGGVSGPFDSFLVLRGLRRLRYAWSGIAPVRTTWHAGSPSSPRWLRCTTPVCPCIRSTNWRSARCAPSAAW
jgi:cystathionine gamma-lyase